MKIKWSKSYKLQHIIKIYIFLHVYFPIVFNNLDILIIYITTTITYCMSNRVLIFFNVKCLTAGFCKLLRNRKATLLQFSKLQKKKNLFSIFE